MHLLLLDKDELRVATRIARAELADLDPDNDLFKMVVGGDDEDFGLLAAYGYLRMLQAVINLQS